ncbi:MAG: hypothetical protein WC640_02845 [Candidatus Paceibacterota bacterium]|jgi:hypothetical protein
MPNVDTNLYSFFASLLEEKLLAYGINVPVLSVKLAYWLDITWFVCLFLAVVFFAGIIYFASKISEIRQIEYERVYGRPGLVEEIRDSLEITPPKQNQDWEKILKLIGSDNPNDWKLAIIEADKMLEVVVSTFSVPGDNIGDKLKNIEKSDFNSLEEAWQAHKVRNRIAHEHNFHLSQREAKIAIDNFEKVFREFDFI